MLRRRLLVNLGPLVLLLLATALAAIWPLQWLLGDLDHITDEAWQVVEDVNRLSVSINVTEISLHELRSGRVRHLDALIDSVEQTRETIDRVSRSYVVHRGEAARLYAEVRRFLPEFEQHVAALATIQDEQLAQVHTDAALETAMALRQATLPLSHYVREHANDELVELTARFRWLAIGLILVFLLVINVSVVVLLRTARMVLRPVEDLVAATGELARERYDYRIELRHGGEFDQLADAYNRLAEQLQSNEARKMQTLRQVALAMNHELNNAAAIIDLQLERMSRQSGGNAAVQDGLKQIRTSLGRMTHSVQALKNVRRIVLTDYVPGEQMLDLERSAEEEEPSPSGTSAP